MRAVSLPALERPAPVGALAGVEHRCLYIEKPWGGEVVWALTELYCGKLLYIDAGQSLSLQLHRRKDETICVQQGRIELTVGRTSVEVGPGAAFRIRPSVVHRMRALEASVVLEASTPELEDVVRLEDAYGRREHDRP